MNTVMGLRVEAMQGRREVAMVMGMGVEMENMRMEEVMDMDMDMIMEVVERVIRMKGRFVPVSFRKRR